MADIRIDKYLSVALNISRTDAKRLIKSGKISTDGKAVKTADFKVSETEEVLYSGKRLEYKKHIYIIMNKPEGILSACTDKRVKTIIDILPEDLKREGLSPVGRLDKNTTGLILITDDGDFAHRVISPKSNIEKCYIAELDGDIKDEDVTLFASGVTLADGELCRPAKLTRTDTNRAEITVSEGKYHQIKRMFGIVSLGVNKLHRKRIGSLSLPDDLASGEARELKHDELSKLLVDLNK